MTKLDLTLVATYDLGFHDARRLEPRREYHYEENQRLYDQGYDDAMEGNAFRASFKVASS